MPSAAPRRNPGWAPRWTVTVLLLAGLFAMHGLPTAGAATPSSTVASMAMTATTAATPPAVALADPGRRATLTAVMSGCGGADHCTATLRAADVAAPPALVGSRAVDDASSALHHVVTETVTARGPPPPDLQELCISRT